MSYDEYLDMPDGISELRSFAFSRYAQELKPELAAALRQYVGEYDQLLAANRKLSNAPRRMQNQNAYYKRVASELRDKLAKAQKPAERIVIKRVPVEVMPDSARREIRALHRAIEDHREIMAKMPHSRPADVQLYRAIQPTTARERGYWSAENAIRPERHTEQEAA